MDSRDIVALARSLLARPALIGEEGDVTAILMAAGGTQFVNQEVRDLAVKLALRLGAELNSERRFDRALGTALVARQLSSDREQLLALELVAVRALLGEGRRELALEKAEELLRLAKEVSAVALREEALALASEALSG